MHRCDRPPRTRWWRPAPPPREGFLVPRTPAGVRRTAGAALFFLLAAFLASCADPRREPVATGNGLSAPLPPPALSGPVSVEEALAGRRSVRDYADVPLTLAELAQLLWAAQGQTDPRGFRTAPSAGALYPLELFAVVGAVEGLGAGLYHYVPADHVLYRQAEGDLRGQLADRALGQSCVRRAPVVLVFAAVPERTTIRYGHRGHRYVYMEVGHAAQNVHLQAESLGLGTVVVGAFDDEGVRDLLALPRDHEPLYLMPVGRLVAR